MKRIYMKAKFNGKCNHCLKQVARGTSMFYDPDHKAVFHPACKDHPWTQIVVDYGAKMYFSRGGGRAWTGRP